MQRKFIVNIIILIGLNLLIKPFWIFGIDRTVQNLVDAETYGMYFALFNFTFLFNIALDMGITNFNNRSVARCNDFLKESFARIFSLKLLLFVFYFMLMLITGIVIGYNSLQIKMLIPLLINQFLAGFILYLRSNISGLLLFKTDSLLSVIDRVIMIVFCGILLWGNVTTQPFQITWFIYIQTFAYAFTCLLALAIVIHKSSFHTPFIDLRFFKTILRKSIPFAILHLFTSIHNRVDTVLIERLLPLETGAAQAGIYASAYRLLDAGIIVAYLMSVICMPLFSNMIAQKKKVNDIVKTSFILLYIYGLIIACASFVYNHELMDLLYVKHVTESAAVFRVLMLSIFPIVLTYIFGSLLTANGNLKQLNIIALSGVGINILINALFITRWGAMASAVAAIVTHSYIVMVEIAIAMKKFQFQISRTFILRLSIFAFGVMAINLISYRLPFHWGIDFIIMLIATLVLVFVSRLINIKQVLSLFKAS